MKTSGWIGSIGLLLLTAGCGQNQTTHQAASPSATVVASPSVAVSPIALQTVQPPTATIAVPPAPPVLAVPDLIPPTSAAARVPQISAGRSNPYATVNTPPRATVSPTATRPSVAVQPVARPVAPAQASTQAIRPPVVPAPIASPVPSAPIARSIAVSGVVQTSGRTSAIVQIPQEGSRYVSVGDRLAGGRVLVKRIEAGAEDAIVVFEQDGVEIIRAVGAIGVL